MPLGGYKGSGLAMMAEILCAVLSGGAMSTELGGIRIQGQPMRASHLFLAIDVARFMPLDEFARRMQSLVGMVKSSRPAKGSRKCWSRANRNGAPKCSAGAMESRCPRARGRIWLQAAEKLGVAVPG